MERLWCESTLVGTALRPERCLLIWIGHCINQLRQVIMCQPDLGVFGQIWVDPIHRPFVNFNNEHKCKNYDAIKRKAIELQVPKDEKLIVRLQDGDIRVAEIP